MNRKDSPFGSFKCEQLEVLVALNASCTEMNIFSILDQVRSGHSDFIILHTNSLPGRVSEALLFGFYPPKFYKQNVPIH